MVDVLRADPGSYGVVSGVGMHMTKHVYGVYSTEPGPLAPPAQADVQRELDARHPARPIVAAHDGDATVAAYSVIHGRDGTPETGVLVCDVDGARTYGQLTGAGALTDAEHDELIGRVVRLAPQPTTLPTGEDGVVNLATLT
jgi:acetyl-CoA C-acetyltransferase